jgi:hypothetical protein
MCTHLLQLLVYVYSLFHYGKLVVPPLYTYACSLTTALTAHSFGAGGIFGCLQPRTPAALPVEVEHRAARLGRARDGDAVEALGSHAGHAIAAARGLLQNNRELLVLTGTVGLVG